MLMLSPISLRSEFGKLLNTMELVGEGVEVGTHRGEFAAQIRKVWLGRMLHCVDPWDDKQSGYQDQIETLPDRGPTREDDYRACVEKLSKWKHSVHIIRKDSRAGSEEFKKGSLDFVYLDGDHAYQAILSDLQLWWPKLRSGGIMSGHDFLCPGENKGGWGMNVQHALFRFLHLAPGVDPFATNIYLLPENTYDMPWSFYIIKN